MLVSYVLCPDVLHKVKLSAGNFQLLGTFPTFAVELLGNIGNLYVWLSVGILRVNDFARFQCIVVAFVNGVLQPSRKRYV